MSFVADLLSGEYQLSPDVDLASLAALYETRQEPAVHGEGNVGVHTEMVLDVTERLLREEARLDPELSRLAAVFHDLGKPQTTRKTRLGRWAAPGHEQAGFEMLGPLFDLDPVLSRYSASFKAAVRALVREHLWSYNIEGVSRGAAIRLSHLVDPRQAYALWRADVEGRVSEDQGELLDEVEYSWEMLKEMGASEPGARPYEAEAMTALGYDHLDPQVRSELLRAVVRGSVQDPGAAMALVAERRARGRGRLIYTMGLPGSGKSTLSAALAKEFGFVHLSYDAARRRDRGRLRAANWVRLETGLRAGETVVVDATHLERRQRDPFMTVAYRHRAEICAVLFEASLGEAIAAQKGRAAGVPEEVLWQMAEKFRYPTPDEYGQLVSIPAKSSVGERVRMVLDAVEESAEAA